MEQVLICRDVIVILIDSFMAIFLTFALGWFNFFGMIFQQICFNLL